MIWAILDFKDGPYYIFLYKPTTSMQCLESPLRCDRQMRHSHSHGIIDGIGDCSTDGYDGRFYDVFGTKRTKIGGNFDQDCIEMWRILDMWQRIIHKSGREQLAVLVINQALI